MSVDLRALKLDPSAPAFFRWRQVGDNVVITNFEGNFLILSEDEFRAFADALGWAIEGTIWLLSAVRAVGNAFLQGRLHGAIAIQLALDMQHGDGDS